MVELLVAPTRRADRRRLSQLLATYPELPSGTSPEPADRGFRLSLPSEPAAVQLLWWLTRQQALDPKLGNLEVQRQDAEGRSQSIHLRRDLQRQMRQQRRIADLSTQRMAGLYPVDLVAPD
jgi:hypothetical protein